jgi:hypothetical protein
MNHAAFDGYTCGLGDVLPDATDDHHIAAVVDLRDTCSART